MKRRPAWARASLSARPARAAALGSRGRRVLRARALLPGRAMSDPPVVTRIAPSPTGSMHIGNARSALFNWLYAKHTGGKFLLRIEDTDRERSTEASVQVIFDSLSWLELEWDGEPVFQHARADLHRAAVGRLMASGHAYRDYMSVAEADAAKEQARAEGHA